MNKNNLFGCLSIRKIILGMMVVFLVSGGALKELHSATLVDGIAAVVGSDIILLSDIRAREAVYKGHLRSKQVVTRHDILEELIDERLLRQELDRIGIVVSPQEMDQALRSVLAQNRMTLPQLKKELLGKGIPWDAYQQDLSERIRIMKFMSHRIHSQVNVTDDDMDLYRRRYPNKAKQQSEEEIKKEVLEVKSRDYLKSYIREVRERTYVEIKEFK